MKTTTFRVDEKKLGQIDKMAKSLNRSRNWIINEALDRFMEYEEWFVKQVEEGIMDVDNDNTVSHEQMKEKLHKWASDAD